MIRRQVLTAVAGVFTLPTIALADNTKIDKTWFIQAWTNNTSGKPFIMNDSASPGRMEVYLNGTFVACCQAAAIKNWDYYELAPISVGFILKANNVNGIKFILYDELRRLTELNTRITEV